MVFKHDVIYILILSLVCFACFLVMGYFILRPKEKRRPVLRIMLSFTAMLSLLALIAEPQIKTTQRQKTAILLTYNSNLKKLDQLVDSLPEEALIFSLDQAWNKFTLRKITPIVTAAHILINYPDIETIYILGDGLDEANKTLLEEKEIVPLLNHFEPGIAHFTCPASLHLGEHLTIQGDYQCEDTATLYLTGLDSHSDSAKVDKHNGRFELSLMPPKVSGRQAFILSTGLTSDTIYVNVAPFVPLEIVAFVSSPGFEFNALKNWLADKHHHLAVRTKVSKDKFNYDYLNWVKEERKNMKLLEMADLLITDSRSLKDLSSVEKAHLQKNIIKGLKVIIMSDESLKPGDKAIPGFMDISLKAAKEPARNVSPQWPGKTVRDFSVKGDGLIPAGGDYISVIRDQHNDALVAQQFYGKGAAALVMIKDSYTLLLSGLEEKYGELWSCIIDRMEVQNDASVSFYISPDQPAFVGKPFSIVQHSADPVPAYVYSNRGADTLYFSQDKMKDGTFSAVFWPEYEGWHEVVSSIDSTAGSFFYVYGPGHFAALQQKENAYTVSHTAKKVNNAAQRAGMVPVNPLIFFMMFLFSAGGLWLEKKIGG